MMKHICFEIYRQIKNVPVSFTSAVGVGTPFKRNFENSVLYSDGNSFCEVVVLDSFNMIYSDGAFKS